MMLNSLILVKWMGSEDTQHFAELLAHEQRKQASILCHQMCSSDKLHMILYSWHMELGVNAQVLIKQIKWQ